MVTEDSQCKTKKARVIFQKLVYTLNDSDMPHIEDEPAELVIGSSSVLNHGTISQELEAAYTQHGGSERDGVVVGGVATRQRVGWHRDGPRCVGRHRAGRRRVGWRRAAVAAQRVAPRRVDSVAAGGRRRGGLCGDGRQHSGRRHGGRHRSGWLSGGRKLGERQRKERKNA